MDKHFIWAESYRPSSLETYIGNEFLKSQIQRFIDEKDIPHLLFSGPPGTGKSTAAKIITKHIECDELYVNASDENSVDTVRTKIKDFASSTGFQDLKIVILDEADFISPSGQAALRNMMEIFSLHTRFILTCNFIERVIDPLVSRTQHFQILPPSKADVGKHMVSILETEEVTFDLPDVKLLIDAHYPDIRKIINECQRATSKDNKLVIHKNEIIASDSNLKIIDVLKSKGDKKKKFQEIRQIVADARMKDFSTFYRMLYDKCQEYAPNTISSVILAIAEGQHRDALVVDREISAMATIINILENT